MAIVAGLF